MGGFPSGQRGQTVNLLQIASVVRIHHHPCFFTNAFFAFVEKTVQGHLTNEVSLVASDMRSLSELGTGSLNESKAKP